MAATFDYYFEPAPENNFDVDYPPPLVVVAPSLGNQTLSELVRFVIENTHLQYNVDGLNTHIDARPLVVEIEMSHRLSEKTFWSIIIDVNDNAEDLIVEYIEKHIARAVKIGNEAMGYCSAQDMVGQSALYAYFDSGTPDGYRTVGKEEKKQKYQRFCKVSDCFLEFLKNCDMDHEVYQNQYILKVLDYLLFVDIPRFLNLLEFRFFTGQIGLQEMEFQGLTRYLNYQGVEPIGMLKLIVERYLDLVDRHWNSRLDLLHLCAVVYGSNYELTEDVLLYCQSKIVIDRKRSLNFANSQLHKRRMLRDMKLEEAYRGARRVQYLRDGNPYRQPINTGFHQWPPERERWERIDSVFEEIVK